MATSPNTTWILKRLQIKAMFNPFDNYDVNHYDCLTKLATTLYEKHNNKPYAGVLQFGHMWNTIADPNGELYYPVLIIPYSNEWSKTIICMNRDYNCEAFNNGQYIYISPMSNWETIDFWENLDDNKRKILIGDN
jgi:hypothetical protein